MIGWLERLHDLFPSTKDIENEEPETNLTVERRFFLSGPALLAASFMLLRSKKALAAGATFDEITKQIAQLAIPKPGEP